MLKPTSVNILGKDYSITYVDKASDVDHDGYESMWGQIDYWKRSIRVYDNGRSAADIWHTIIHETLHGIAMGLHLSAMGNKDNHEELDLLALALTDVVFRNDWLRTDDTKGETCPTAS